VALARSNGSRFVPGEVLVRFKNGRSPLHAADVGARSLDAKAVDGWKLVRLEASETTEEAIARLGADPSVAEVTANYVYHSLTVPNDSLFPLQWGLRNTGQTINGDWGSVAGTAGADTSAAQAWDTTTGSGSVIVGVVDSGVAATHPDLKPNVVAGYNFVGDRTTGDTHDVLGHGSHVAGIIGAAGNDGYGVTGVSPHVKILPLRALDREHVWHRSSVLVCSDSRCEGRERKPRRI
jgi:subtilisin family serine protease